MFELLVIACVGLKTCEYAVAPIDYPTESRCAIAAALQAGRVRGAHPPGLELKYEYECKHRQGAIEGAVRIEPSTGAYVRP